MEANENKIHRFYKKCNISVIIGQVGLLLLLVISTFRGIIEGRHFSTIIITIILLIQIFTTMTTILQKSKISKVPALIIDCDEIIAYIGVEKKAKKVMISDIDKMDIPKYDDYVEIYTKSKKISLSLMEYEEHVRKDIKEVLRNLI